MNKKQTIFLLVLLVFSILVGSMFNYFATSYILGDVSNLTFGINNRPYYILSSIPAFNLACIFVLFVIYILRYHRHLDGIKRITRLYIIIFTCLSAIGLVSAVASGFLIYHTFVGPNPYPGYLIIHIVIYSIFIISAILFKAFIYPTMKEDEYIRSINFGYVLYTILMCILIYYAMNRFGSLLLTGSFIDMPTAYMTWPFYFSLILPLCIFVHTFLYTFKFYKSRPYIGVIVISIVVALFIATTIYTYMMCTANTKFISVISPAMGASRLLAKPIDFITVTILFGVFGIISLINSIYYCVQEHNRKKLLED